MSGGLHRIWKDALVSRLAPPRKPRRPYHVLDVAGGTGDVAFRIADGPKARSSRSPTSTARCWRSVASGPARHARPRAQLRRGKRRGPAVCQGSFRGRDDRLRHPQRAADRDRRSPRPTGCSSPAAASSASNSRRSMSPASTGFTISSPSTLSPPSARSLPAMPNSYRYLVESIRKFPNQARFAAMIEAAGFERVEVDNLSGGIAAIHSGWKL